MLGVNTVSQLTHISLYIQKHQYMVHVVKSFLMYLITHRILYKFIRRPGVQEMVVGGLIVWGWSNQ